MQKYTYTVRDANGKTLRGSVSADNREKVILALQNKGYLVLEVKEGSAGLFGGGGKARKRGGKVPGHVLAFFAEQLSTLIAGGVPLVRAVSLLGEYASKPDAGRRAYPGGQRYCGRSVVALRLGAPPQNLQPHWLSLVQAGEVGGQLSETLMQISLYIQNAGRPMKSKSHYGRLHIPPSWVWRP